MKISNRLKTIVDYVPKNSIVSDIGSDHAILPAYLLENKITNKAIASDINENPVKKAKQKFSHIDMRIGDGLSTIKEEEIDTIIISGMGGETIIKILDTKKIEKANTIILSPNTHSYLVRKFMMKKRFHIEKESLVLDKKHIYEIIVFKKGKKKYSNKELWLGPLILKEKNGLFYQKYKEELTKYKSFYSKIPFSFKKIITKIKIIILNKEVRITI